MVRIPDSSLLESELVLSATRSGGPGGQHVNKVSTKVILKFNVLSSRILTEEEKAQLQVRLSGNLTRQGELVVSSQSSRSQSENKQLAKDKLDALLRKAFVKKKSRKATKPSRTAVEKRLRGKQRQSQKKKWRRTEE